MVTFDKDKMKQMLDEVLAPAIEKHSETLDTLIDNNQNYLIKVELELIANKLEQLVKHLEENNINVSNTFNRSSENIIDVSAYQKKYKLKDWQHNHSNIVETDKALAKRSISFNIEKIA